MMIDWLIFGGVVVKIFEVEKGDRVDISIDKIGLVYLLGYSAHRAHNCQVVHTSGSHD
jgi:hypothetical protein